MIARIGTFVLTSDTLFAGDPLYLFDPQCRAQIDHCALGTWGAWAVPSDIEKQIVFCTPLVRTLAVFHENCPLERETVLEMEAPESGSNLPDGFEMTRIRTHPESSMMCMYGFFDRTLAGEDLERDLGGLAGLCEDLTPKDPPYSAVLLGGVVSTVMRQDGLCFCFVHRNDAGQADAAFLRFL